MKRSIDQLCDEEIQPIVVNKKTDEYRRLGALTSIGILTCYAGAMGMITTNILALAAYGSINLGTLAIAGGLLVFQDKVLNNDLCSLIQNYKEDKQ